MRETWNERRTVNRDATTNPAFTGLVHGVVGVECQEAFVLESAAKLWGALALPPLRLLDHHDDLAWACFKGK